MSLSRMPLALLIFILWAMVLLEPPGPNSGITDLSRWMRLCLLVVEVRVPTFPCRWEVNQATSCFSSKHNGQGRAGPFGTTPQPVVKRSLLRARRRAHQHGWCVYKGRTLLPSQLPSIFSWNTGGLTSAGYSAFMHWASDQQLDIIMLQGTLWKEGRTRTAFGYHVVQSGEPQSHRLLTMISVKLCTKEAIAFASPIPGRLLRVRCCIGDKALDILNVYQRPDSVVEAPMNGIHVDRFASHSGAVQKQQWILQLQDSIMLPFWTEVILHSGQDAHGHLQSCAGHCVCLVDSR